ncbi:MAG: hypothetical protein JW932_12325 [Deltaproteobacteria bacterium]|nr:hypothetical protein [Deltaproteobacteria bacterium]
MQVIENALLWLVQHFNTPRYMFHTKLQALVWSLADIVLVFAFLKIIDRMKRKEGRKGITVRFWFLYCTAGLKIIPFFFGTPEMFISLDFLICGLQYAILVYTIIVDRKTLMALPQHCRNIGP